MQYRQCIRYIGKGPPPNPRLLCVGLVSHWCQRRRSLIIELNARKLTNDVIGSFFTIVVLQFGSVRIQHSSHCQLAIVFSAK